MNIGECACACVRARACHGVCVGGGRMNIICSIWFDILAFAAGLSQYRTEDNASHSRTQHNASGEARTSDLSISSPLSHCAPRRLGLWYARVYSVPRDCLLGRRLG